MPTIQLVFHAANTWHNYLVGVPSGVASRVRILSIACVSAATEALALNAPFMAGPLATVLSSGGVSGVAYGGQYTFVSAPGTQNLFMDAASVWLSGNELVTIAVSGSGAAPAVGTTCVVTFDVEQ